MKCSMKYIPKILYEMLSEIYFQNFGHGDTNLSSQPLILGNSERRGSSARGSLRNPISQRTAISQTPRRSRGHTIPL